LEEKTERLILHGWYGQKLLSVDTDMFPEVGRLILIQAPSEIGIKLGMFPGFFIM
jgi:hypothetical protein